jgi:hypothetical protein
MAIPTGIISPVPAPCAARAPTSSCRFCATAHSAEDAQNTVRLTR